MRDSDSVRVEGNQAQRRLERERKARAEAEAIALDALNRFSVQAEELKEQSEELEKALAESRTAYERRRNLINAAAHVLRTPLTSLLIRLHGAASRAPPELKGSLAEAKRMADAMNEVLNDLTRLEQLEVAGLVTAPAVMDLTQLLKESDGIELRNALDYDVPVVVDRRRLLEVFDVIRRTSSQSEKLSASIHDADDEEFIVLKIEASRGTQTDERELVGLGSELIKGLAKALHVGVHEKVDGLGHRIWTFQLERP